MVIQHYAKPYDARLELAITEREVEVGETIWSQCNSKSVRNMIMIRHCYAILNYTMILT